ncbi:histidine-type phosphatase [uncultured Treponema sp.]|uniref:histidine-type phosphatase n=1 Tax=uncultured Treponema sp. TaxID=162155 RepID=UPI0025D4DA5D|nr:histidine-type phosphatase [uncultured Treponema sp.]
MNTMKRFLFLTAIAAVIQFSFFGCASSSKVSQKSEELLPRVERVADFHERYSLERVVVLSRHNIRSPLSGNGSALSKLTPHQWFNWTSAPSELSLRGGVLETVMGQYFRKWLESEKLIPENYIPKNGEMRFYANSMQRTIATAQYFSSGMLPVANVQIEHKYLPSKMDAVFTPQITHIDDAFEKKARNDIENLGGNGGLNALCKTLLPAYAVLEKTLDFDQSAYAQENSFNHFKYDDTEIILKENNEPSMKGSLKTATSASDALVLQYYEEPDVKKAAFGHKLSEHDWELIASIKDVYGDVLFTAPSVAKQCASPLLSVIKEELTVPERKFSFLCGHDSNIGSVLASLDVESYELPCAIEKKTPIGSKVVISVWKDKSGAEFAELTLVYQTVAQLRSMELLTLENPPAVYSLSLTGLSKNGDGLYLLPEVTERCAQAVQ